MTAVTHDEAPGSAATLTEGQKNIRVGSSAHTLPPLTDNIWTGRPTDLASLSPEAFAGYLAGAVDGFRDGYAACIADDLERVWPAARAVVANHAKAPARDHLADRRRAENREAWWAARRGEAA